MAMSEPAPCPTRYAELGYRPDAPGLWRLVDQTTLASVGPHYHTKGELFGDLDRYARDFGCEGTSNPLADAPKPGTEQHPLFRVSTDGILASDARRLHSCASFGHPFPEVNCGTLASSPACVLLWIGDAGLHARDIATMRRAGFSPGFAALIDRLHRRVGGFCYLMLNAEAEATDTAEKCALDR
jgi:hypothetical protein